MKKKIYLAGPYSHENPDVMKDRASALTKVAGQLTLHDYLVYSPITHAITIVDMFPEMPHSFEFWKELDISMIRDWADEVWILNIQGWDTSIGVEAEIKFAYSIQKKVFLFTQEPLMYPCIQEIKVQKYFLSDAFYLKPEEVYVDKN